MTLILHVLNHSSVEESMLKLVVKIILKLSQTFQSLFLLIVWSCFLKCRSSKAAHCVENCIRQKQNFSTRMGKWHKNVFLFSFLSKNLISSKIPYLHRVWMFQLLSPLWKCLLSNLMVTFISLRKGAMLSKCKIFNKKKRKLNHNFTIFTFRRK